MKKIKHFTHTDLDGIACGLLTNIVYNRCEVDISHCDYDNIDEEILKYVDKEGLKKSKIIITDIGISKETAEKLNILEEIEIEYFDHHKTNMWMNEYSWAHVRVEEAYGEDKEILKDSATNIYYEYLVDSNLLIPEEIKDKFVEEVRRYDTWEWKNKYNTQSPKQLNDLLDVYGREKFKDKMFYKLTRGNDVEIIDYRDKEVLIIEDRRKEEYIIGKLETVIYTELEGYKVGVVYLEQYHSELCHRVLESNLEIDFVVGINMSKGTISYRSREGGVDVSEIALKYGGGGHKNASGSEIGYELKEKIVGKILKRD